MACPRMPTRLGPRSGSYSPGRDSVGVDTVAHACTGGEVVAAILTLNRSASWSSRDAVASRCPSCSCCRHGVLGPGVGLLRLMTLSASASAPFLNCPGPAPVLDCNRRSNRRSSRTRFCLGGCSVHHFYRVDSGTIMKVTEFFTFTALPAGVKENGGLFSFPSFSQIAGSKDPDFKSFTSIFLCRPFTELYENRTSLLLL